MSRYIDTDDLIRYGKRGTLVYWEDILNAPSIDIDLADDGTLSVEVDDATKVKRVLVEDGKYGNLYYADRPQGEWRKHDDERDYCTRCKHIFKTRTITPRDKWTVYIDDLGYNYCPNCGARMFAKDTNVPNKKGTDDDTSVRL